MKINLEGLPSLPDLGRVSQAGVSGQQGPVGGGQNGMPATMPSPLTWVPHIDFGHFGIPFLPAIGGTTAGIRAEDLHSSADAVNSYWSQGAVNGRYSEKASHHGQPGIGDPRWATVADGGEMRLAVTGLHERDAAPTRVLALDAGAIQDWMRSRYDHDWPSSPEEMRAVLMNHDRDHRPFILADVQASSPPQEFSLGSIPAGTRVTVLAGAEALMDVPPRSPTPSQAMVVNRNQVLEPEEREQLPKTSHAGGVSGGASKVAPMIEGLIASLQQLIDLFSADDATVTEREDNPSDERNMQALRELAALLLQVLPHHPRMNHTGVGTPREGPMAR